MKLALRSTKSDQVHAERDILSCNAVLSTDDKTVNTAANRGLGSVDIKNVCRSVLTVGVHPDDETTRVIGVAKSNLGRPCDALTYQLDTVEVTANDGSSFSVAKVVWTGTAAIRADALTLSQPDEQARSAIEDAYDRIRESLSTARRPCATNAMFFSAMNISFGLGADGQLPRASTELASERSARAFCSRSPES